MKQILVIMALLCFYCSTSAQLKVKPAGYTTLGDNSMEDTFDSTPGVRDTTTMLKIFGPGENSSRGRLSFGDQYYDMGKYVMVGEWGDDDTDQLWLHGAKGFVMTYGIEAADTVMSYYARRNQSLQINVPVNTASIALASDARFKDDIQPVNDALGVINSLSGVSYLLKTDRGIAKNRPASKGDIDPTGKMSQMEKELEELRAERAKGTRHYGFIAQEVEQVLPELVHTGEDGYKYVDYISVVPLLVNAVKQLQSELCEVKAPMKSNAITASDDIASDMLTPALYQNVPNPFTAETVIRYDLPETMQQAVLYVYDMQGKQIKSITVEERGSSSVTIQGSELPAGMYIYALIADGKEIASKRMILTK